LAGWIPFDGQSIRFAFRAEGWQSRLVNDLQPPDSHHLAAAQGWLDLLAFEDAARELAFVGPAFREHPDVLQVRWALAANGRRWDEALAIARTITRLVPTKPEGWIYEGTALAELGRHAEGHSVLLQGHERFPQDEILIYDLGCVCCALNRDAEAIEWVHKAIVVAGAEILNRAIEDPDLQRIRDRLKHAD
jgi:predicted Zn-dependent protease